jgi:hypothetical protein
MKEMHTVSEKAGSLVESDARIWRSIGMASRLAEGRARSVPNLFQSPHWAQIESEVLLGLQEAKVRRLGAQMETNTSIANLRWLQMGFIQLLRELDIYVVYLFDNGYALPGLELAGIMDSQTIEAARRELGSSPTILSPV